MVCAHHGALPLATAPSKTIHLSHSSIAGSLSPSPFKRPGSGISLRLQQSSTSSLGATSSFAEPTRASASRSSLVRSSSSASSFTSSRKDDSNWDTGSHIVELQTAWHSHSRGYAVPWGTQTRSTALTVGLQAPRRPTWVASDVGRPLSASLNRPFTAYLRGVAPPAAAPKRPSWDRSFPVAHAIDRNPVENGVRKGLCNSSGQLCCNVSPSRRWEER